MYKASYKDIKWLLGCDDSAEVKELFKGIQPSGLEVAYFAPSAPSGANWRYRVLITTLNDKHYEVVTVFGEVKGGRLVNL